MTRSPQRLFVRLQERVINARLGFVPVQAGSSRIHILTHSHHTTDGTPMGRMLCGLHSYLTPYEGAPIDSLFHKPCSKCFTQAAAMELRMQIKEEEAPACL